MQIDFYEEFPTKKNLEKLKLVKHKIRLFVAAKSLKEFQKLKNQIKKIKKNSEVAYWPIIPEVYYISSFMHPKILKETLEKLENNKNFLLIDLELPGYGLKNRIKYIIKYLPALLFSSNKKIIKKFLDKNHKRITTAEFPNSLVDKINSFLGIRFETKAERSLMWYSSMFPKKFNKSVKKYLLNIKNKKNYSISLGTIATGVLKTEPILSPEKLEKDLKFVEKAGFNKVIVFRLGGLNKKYIKIINKFQK